MQRPARAPGDTKSLDEGTDTYDTIEWLLKNVPRHNGRVGMLGVSYDGWTTIMGAIEPHPALKAISPQASPADMWLGDDFHHNGAFRLSYAFEYATMMESGKDVKNFEFDRYDTFDWYLSLGPLSAVNRKYLRETIPTWNDYVRHPDYDEFWKRQTMVPHIRSVKVPTLNVAGWWDQEDFYGPLTIYEALEKHDTANQNYLVVGPVEPRRLDARRHGARPDRFRRRHGRVFPRPGAGAVLRLFPEGQGHARLPRSAHVRSRAPTSGASGASGRRPRRPRPSASTSAPNEAAGHRHAACARRARRRTPSCRIPRIRCPTGSGPFSPPTSPAGRSGPRGWSRTSASSTTAPTCSVGRSPPLKEDLTIAGEVVAKLFASTTGTDADWVVKLIDVYPEHHPENWNLAGYQLMVSNEVFRGRYRKGFETPAPIPAGTVQPYSFSLHTQNYTFKAGHRVMVQVQSTWFPIIDRNPQTFTKSIFDAEERDFVKATHRVYRSARYPSRVEVPVVGPAIIGPVTSSFSGYRIVSLAVTGPATPSAHPSRPRCAGWRTAAGAGDGRGPVYTARCRKVVACAYSLDCVRQPPGQAADGEERLARARARSRSARDRAASAKSTFGGGTPCSRAMRSSASASGVAPHARGQPHQHPTAGRRRDRAGGRTPAPRRLPAADRRRRASAALPRRRGRPARLPRGGWPRRATCRPWRRGPAETAA